MTFEEAQNSVKIGHFTRKGGKIRGVIHVGANDGEEIEGYLGLGATHVLALEPLLIAQRKLLARWAEDPRVLLLPFALDSTNRTALLGVASGDGKGSTFLEELSSPYEFIDSQWTYLRRFDSLPISTELFNTLVVDVQGMEMQVLRGFGEYLKWFEFLNVECSRVPLYEGESSAQDIINFLVPFQQDSPIEDHNDIMFVHRSLGWPMLY